jgi:hypothetical protein
MSERISSIHVAHPAIAFRLHSIYNTTHLDRRKVIKKEQTWIPLPALEGISPDFASLKGVFAWFIEKYEVKKISLGKEIMHFCEAVDE